LIFIFSCLFCNSHFNKSEVISHYGFYWHFLVNMYKITILRNKFGVILQGRVNTVNTNTFYISKLASREGFSTHRGFCQHKEMINVWSDGNSNYPNWIIIQYRHIEMSLYHTT
jgi:hypothetical protein